MNVVVDSGCPIAFGDFEITGTQRYPEQTVSGLARFQPGTPYDLDLLLDFQQAPNKTDIIPARPYKPTSTASKATASPSKSA